MKLSLVGNLGADAELQFSAEGRPILRFSVAAKYRDRNGLGNPDELTEWVRCAVIGKRAESLSPYLCKGTRVFVDGQLRARPWADCENQLRAGLEVLVDQIEFMTPRGTGDHGGAARPGRPLPERQTVGVGSDRRGDPEPDDDGDLAVPF